MHHSSDEPQGLIKRIADEAKRKQMEDAVRQLESQMGLGATGQFPQGKLDATDEGELKLAVGIEDDKVVIAFGKPVAWFGMDWKQAMQLAFSLKAKAEQVRKEQKRG